MSGNRECSVFIGNLDERVTERVLYDILKEAGRVVDLHIPKDRETDRAKGYAFAEFETEEIAEYAVKLFSGLLTLYNRTLRFAISGQDKTTSNNVMPPPENTNHRFRYNPSSPMSHVDATPSNNRNWASADNEDELLPPGVSTLPSHYRSMRNGSSNDYSRRQYEGSSDTSSRPRSGRYDY